MSPDDRVDLIKHISEERRERILPGLAQAEREDARQLKQILKLDPEVLCRR